MRLLWQFLLVIAFCLGFSPSPAASPQLDFERALINSLANPQACEPMPMSRNVIEELASPSVLSPEKPNPSSDPFHVAGQFDGPPETYLEADVFSPDDGEFDVQAYRRSLADNYRRIGGAFELFDSSSAVEVKAPEPSQIRQYLLQYRTARSSYPIKLDKQLSLQAQDDLRREDSLSSSGPWLLGRTAMDYYTVALMIYAPGAQDLSVTLDGLGELPAGSTAHVYGQDRQAIEFTQYFVSELNAWITPPVKGEKVLLHLSIPVDGSTSSPVKLRLLNLDFGVDRREILGTDSGGMEPGGVPTAASSPCFENECFHSGECFGTSDFAEIEALRRATVFLSQSVCTGTLIAHSGGSDVNRTPYLITANHCISTQAAANTEIFYFDYRMDTCNGPCPLWFSFPNTQGATMLYTSEEQDVTLLRLNGALPAGRAYMGWSSAPVHTADGLVLHRLHHADRQAQHYSRGIVDSSYQTNCGINHPIASGNWIRQVIDEGLTMGGSSGSGTVDSQGRLRGQNFGRCFNLFDGTMNCPNPSGRRVDGAFAAYFESVRFWLAPPALRINPSFRSVSSSSGSTSTTVFNPGADPLQWSASSGCGWATPTNSSGSIAPNSSAVISISYQANSGSSQRHCNIEFTGQDGTIYGPNVLQITQSGTAPDPSDPPSVTTRSAIDVTQTSARLRGRANPNGSSTSAWFQWGASPSYGNTTTSQNLGSGTTNVNYDRLISGLSCGTTYYFRARAQNNAGISNGSQQSFTTQACSSNAPEIVIHNLSNASSNRISIQTDVNPNGGWTSVHYDWGLSAGNFPNSFEYDRNPIDPNDTNSGGLYYADYYLYDAQCGTTYYFRPRAVNASGTGTAVPDSITTPPCPVAPPVVENLAADEIAPDQARLRGRVNAQGHPTEYRFRWGQSSLNNSTSWMDAGSGTTLQTRTAILTGLQCDTDYQYRIEARNDGGTSQANSSQSFRTDPCRVLTVNSSPVSGVSISASPSSAGGTTNYTRTVPDGMTVQLTAPLKSGGGNFSSWSGCSSVGGSGNRTCTVNMTANRVVTASYQNVPTAVTLSADSIDEASARLRGTVNPSGLTTDVYFEVEPLGVSTNTENIGDGTSDVTVTATLSELECGTAYSFRVRAESSAGDSVGAWLDFTTDSCSASPPGTPSEISYPTLSDDGVISVAWDSASQATSYELQRSAVSEPWALIYTGSSLSFDEALPDGSYRYRVRGLNEQGFGSWRTGHELIVQLPDSPGVPAGIAYSLAPPEDSVLVHWIGSDHATAYQLQRLDDDLAGWETVYEGSQRQYDASDLAANYRFRVRAMNPSGASGWRWGGIGQPGGTGHDLIFGSRFEASSSIPVFVRSLLAPEEGQADQIVTVEWDVSGAEYCEALGGSGIGGWQGFMPRQGPTTIYIPPWTISGTVIEIGLVCSNGDENEIEEWRQIDVVSSP